MTSSISLSRRLAMHRRMEICRKLLPTGTDSSTEENTTGHTTEGGHSSYARLLASATLVVQHTN